MNKIVVMIKRILLIILLLLIGVFVIKNGILDFRIWLFIIGFLDIIILNIKEMKNKIFTSNKYNCLFILGMLIICIILIRSLWDQTFIFNLELTKEIKTLYFAQNVVSILIILASLHLYYLIETKEQRPISKYSLASLICFVCNIILFQYTINLFENYLTNTTFPLLFFAGNTILLVVEIVSLIKNNGLKKEWPIYICFLFNLFAYISMFI